MTSPPPPLSNDPRPLLLSRIEARRQTVAALERRDARIASLRLAIFTVALAIAIASLGLHRMSSLWLALPIATFIVLLHRHDRALRALARARRGVAFHEGGIARLDDRWSGTGDDGERYARDEHPYARDLDLFGHGSLFELLSTARTRPGSDLLARWLLAPATAAEIRIRQRSISDLRPRLDLREDLATLGEELRSEVHPERLAAWAEAPRVLPGKLALPALALAAANLTTFACWLEGKATLLPFGLTAAATWILLRIFSRPLQRVLGGVERPGAELKLLAETLGRLEREPFEDVHLRALREALISGDGSASARIAALGRTVERGAWASNQFFAPLALLLCWRLLTGLSIERWRSAHGASVRVWLSAMAELEALASLAAHAFLHPGDPFPDLDDAPAARFEAEALGHPLLPADRCVRNDVRLGEAARLLVVSGSNMAGKSTFLRTVGVNAVLALAGAPVRARRLRLSPLKLGATLRIQDSLAEGRSRFWAEITRLRALSDDAGQSPPLLFLLDELLAGTNSRDRRIGAEAVLRALLAKGAIGLVTTHDLALSELVGTMEAVVNAHFADEVRGTEVIFDYRLRPGVATGSNALALMRAVGLEVE